ncbi:hypothetical protein [Pseudobacter ginsenosidimutans]|jgi:hypothetical protein|uniref:Uncharacterized protein n=1 Tax=Pseudobacter ginsenosidimutans TaxID=661488 RepID=A0A4Q7MS04_9BACT|nr:hypothetical protein [Pseudobacter ginsenosidimutans]QEC41935.1 hypothetical protein FSB84_09640 [Pseudobacter ginsenosidimutans]RZS71238.1 hypothetical protein EV199_3140 [Pseudobacter ginsenosidimutans]
MEDYPKTEQNSNPQQVNEADVTYKSEASGELARLRKNMNMSDMDKLRAFTRMLVRNAMYKKAIISHHK